jgi:YVTN family beta-propeller protein
VVTVDLAKLRVVATIPVAPAPEQLAVRPGKRELWVVSGSGTVSVVSFPDLRVEKKLRVGRAARSLVLAPDGRLAFVLEPGRGDVVFIDCGLFQELVRVRLGGLLANLALTPDGETLVVAGTKPMNRLYFVSVRDRKLLGSVEVGQAPGPMVILPDSSLAFVADTGEEKISAVDVSSRQVLSHLEIGSRPGTLILKPDGGELFALSPYAAVLTLIDAHHENVEQSVPTGKTPVAAASRSDSSLLYIVNRGDGSVTTLEVETRAVLALTHVGNEPCALALTPDERFLAVTDCGAGSLAVLRTDGDRTQLLTTIPVGAEPTSVVIPEWTSQR